MDEDSLMARPSSSSSSRSGEISSSMGLSSFDVQVGFVSLSLSTLSPIEFLGIGSSLTVVTATNWCCLFAIPCAERAVLTPQLLNERGWRDGAGLGASEQARLKSS